MTWLQGLATIITMTMLGMFIDSLYLKFFVNVINCLMLNICISLAVLPPSAYLRFSAMLKILKVSVAVFSA